MSKFKKIETGIEGLYILEPTVFGDKRGFFLETYNKKEFEEIGIFEEFVQDNHSKSKKGVLRGLHFQTKHSQGKLVRVIEGSVYDVAVDIRKNSSTFGKWHGIELSAENKKMFFIPKGFAHGFLTLEDETEFQYKCTDLYHPEYDSGIMWNDKDIDIKWNFEKHGLKEEDIVLSEKDKKHQSFKEYEKRREIKRENIINVGYIISHLENSGPVNILYGIIKNLDKKNFKAIIITLKEEKNNSRIKEFKNLGIKVVLCNISDFEIMCRKTFKLDLIIKQEKIDIIHCHCFRSSIFISKLTKNSNKEVSTIHCDFSTDLIYKFGFIIGKLYSYLYLNALKKMDLNISCGKGVSNLILKHNNFKTEAVQNGIDREKINIKNIKLTKEELRKKLDLKENKKYFISVSSLDERKNVLFLAKYFSSTEIENINLILVGSGNKSKEIMNLKSSNIKLTGKLSLEEVQEYLKASDFYISASKSEGLPNSVLEALEFELPVLLSDIEPHKEILENYDCGELFELDNIDSLENKIEKILNKIKNNNEYKKIKVFIDAKRMSKEYEKIYYSLIKDLNNECI